MQIAQENATATQAIGVAIPESSNGGRGPYADYKIIRRNGAVVGFEPAKISVAMTKAFLAVNGSQGAASARIRDIVSGLTEAVVLDRRLELLHVEQEHGDVAYFVPDPDRESEESEP
jgi:ribonucleoside-diphosphate reductase alpha chain